jgi:mono/diheme cytochrome c family protein
MFMDGAFSFIVFVIIVFLALVFPPYLDAKADPTNGAFVPYPAWYFLSLFGLLNLVPIFLGNGPFPELLAAIIVPTIGLVIVLILPWLDRSTTRAFSARRAILWPTVIIVGIIVGLTIYAQMGIVSKQAAGPPSPPEAQVLAAPAAAAETSEASGGATSGVGQSGTASAAGAKVFSTNCSSCHGANGQGSPGAFPPLANNPVVTGDPHKVIGIVLNGLHGSITVAGQTYNGQMPPWKSALSNGDVASVITYIRGSLGSNHASAVTEAQVKNYKP